MPAPAINIKVRWSPAMLDQRTAGSPDGWHRPSACTPVRIESPLAERAGPGRSDHEWESSAGRHEFLVDREDCALQVSVPMRCETDQWPRTKARLVGQPRMWIAIWGKVAKAKQGLRSPRQGGRVLASRRRSVAGESPYAAPCRPRAASSGSPDTRSLQAAPDSLP